MNLFARLLSHGFALIVVALLAIGLIYRGDLFPGMELPSFLALDETRKDEADSVTDAASRDGPDQVSPDDVEQVADEQATEPAISPQPIEAPQPVAAPAGDDAEPVPATTAETGILPGTVARDTDEAAAAADTVGDAVTTTVDKATTTTDRAAEPGVGVPAADTAAETGDMASTAIDKAATTADRPVETVDTVPAAVESATAEAVEAAELPPPADSAGQAAAQTTAAAGEQPAQPDAVIEPAAEVVPAGEIPVTADDALVMPPPVAAAEPADREVVSPYRLLAAAREAYWLRDYATAEQKYQAMIELDPDNPDGYGELGNMYFSQGKWDLASASYFEAGKLLADEGLLTEAQQLVDVLKGLQGPQAGELEKYIADKTPAGQ
jgi:hypothetical protein